MCHDDGYCVLPLLQPVLYVGVLLQASAVAGSKNELVKKLDRATNAQLVLRRKVQLLKVDLREALNNGHLPKYLQGLITAHEEGGSMQGTAHKFSGGSVDLP